MHASSLGQRDCIIREAQVSSNDRKSTWAVFVVPDDVLDDKDIDRCAAEHDLHMPIRDSEPRSGAVSALVAQ